MKEKTRRVIADMTKEISRLTAMVRSRDEKLTEAERQRASQDENLVNLATRVDQLSAENRSLASEAKGLVARVAELEEEKAFLVDKNVNLANRAGYVTTERDNARHALDQVKAEKETLAKQIEVKVDRVAELSGLLREAREALMDQHTESDQLIKRVDQLREAIFAAAADMDILTVEEGDPSLLEVVAALGEKREAHDRANLLLALLLDRLDTYGYSGIHEFSDGQIAAVRDSFKGKVIAVEVSPLDGRVLITVKDEVSS